MARLVLTNDRAALNSGMRPCPVRFDLPAKAAGTVETVDGVRYRHHADGRLTCRIIHDGPPQQGWRTYFLGEEFEVRQTPAAPSGV